MEDKSGSKSILDEGTYEKFRWKLTGDGTLTITGSGFLACDISYSVNHGDGWDGGYDTDEVPWPWDRYSSQVRKIVLGEGITGLTDEAFLTYPNAEEVLLPETLNYIGRDNFCWKALKKLISLRASPISTIGPLRIPLSVTSISLKV